jgi:hypothetical protein
MLDAGGLQLIFYVKSFTSKTGNKMAFAEITTFFA